MCKDERLSKLSPPRHNGDMPRRALHSVILILFCVLALLAGAPKAFCQMGYKGPDLERIGQWLTYNGLELYRLEIPNFAAPYAAALTSGRHGWRIAVFLRDGGVTNVVWDSGYLKKPFQVASTDAFVLAPKVGNDFGVVFSGCKFEDCGNVYGALLYVPARRQFFEKDVGPKSVACSAALDDPANAAALQALDTALARQQDARRQKGDAIYVAPVCPGGRLPPAASRKR